jgi:PDZ domain-containing protein
MSRRAVTVLVSLLLVVVFGIVGALFPVPYVTESPGPTFNTLGAIGGRQLIVVKGHRTYPTDGHLNLVTVSLNGGPGRELGLFNAIAGWLNRHTDVIPEDEVYPKGTTEQQSTQETQLEMDQSQHAATAAALAELGVQPKAIRIQGFVKGAPSAKTLRTGDAIARVGGDKVTTLAQLTKLVSGAVSTPGQPITLTIVRGGKRHVVHVPTMASPDDPKRPIVGIYLEPVWPFDVSFNLSDVGGPSAGMMFALAIIDKLTPGDLTGGKFIAGTGEIAADGTVGAIGGIAQKMVGAHRDGARYFLAPQGNCSDVRKADVPGGLQVIKVATLRQAYADVRAIAAGDASGLPGC